MSITIFSNSARADSCDNAAIQKYIEKFEINDGKAIEAAAQCNLSAVPVFSETLKDKSKSENIRSNSAYVLGVISQGTEQAVPVLTEALSDPSPSVRATAVRALGSIGKAAKSSVFALLKFLKDAKLDADTRAASAISLGLVGEESDLVIPELRKALNDAQDLVQSASAIALGRFGLKSKDTIPDLLKLVKDDRNFVRRAAAWSLGQISEEILNEVKATNKLDQIEAAITTVSEIKTTLDNSQFDEVKEEKQPVTTILEYLRLKKKELQFYIVQQWIVDRKEIWISHPIFWLILIFAYPKSRTVQAIFFWNKYVRDILGFWYVGLALTYIPFLQKKLFEPFKPSLLADAGLSHFNPTLYFPNSHVTLKGTDSPQPITTAFPSINGQIILEGDSGLGKTMFLRHLLMQSQRITVYLPATKCAEGVLEAIQKKLHGDEIKDAKFLQSLIYSGAIDICIDGLNEVNPDTRAKITQFVESHFRGNILMTTQPLEWVPPSTAKTYVMQPLQPEQIEQYLISRQPLLPKTAAVQGIAYEQACRTFLSTVLGDSSSLTPEEHKTARIILSNPMELTIAAWILADGNQPNLFNLREQQYTLMAADYQRTWNQDFPLKKFSETIYQRWLTDTKTLPADDFYNELLCMEDEKFRMVVSRQWQDAKGEAKKEWHFRHDKIAEFFLVQTFLGGSNEANSRLRQHRGDSRFRGVYFLLATLLPLDAAQLLREDLIQYAADTKDHTVSDTFIQLLRSR